MKRMSRLIKQYIRIKTIYFPLASFTPRKLIPGIVVPVAAKDKSNLQL